MPKSLRDLNWPLFVVSMAEALTIALCLSSAANFSWKGFIATSVGLCAKSGRDFFSEAKKQLEQQ